MAQELIHVSLRNPLLKLLLVLLLIIAGVWSYFAVRWYLGDTLAEYFDPSGSNVDVARMAVSLAPSDPLTHWRTASVTQKNLPLDQQGLAIAEYEKAVSLSPNDYRFWMTLGTAYEQAGDNAKAEHALKRAVALAPSYSFPHWYLGNLFVRNGRYDEAFAELRIAANADPELLPQMFNLIWQVHSDDPAGLEKAVGESTSTRAQFAAYLVEQNHPEDGLRLWNGMSSDQKKTNRSSGELIITALNKQYKYHNAVDVWNQITDEKYHTEVGRIFDGSFEEAVNYDAETTFGWQVKGVRQVQIGIDPNRSHSGSRSLRFVFEVRGNIDPVNVLQLVPVQPGTTYDFECYVTTDKLQTASAPQIDILDATNSAVLVSSPMAPSGTNGWGRVSLSFKTGEKSEAVILRIVRVSCNDKDTPVCPIFGTVWYDDFSIKRRN